MIFLPSVCLPRRWVVAAATHASSRDDRPVTRQLDTYRVARGGLTTLKIKENELLLGFHSVKLTKYVHMFGVYISCRLIYPQ